MMKILNQIYITILLLLTSSMLMAEVRYLHTDMMGSVISVSDEQGNIISRNHYEPFGKRIDGEKEGIGYTGHLQDTDLGLTYMQARYYDPLIGRFYSNDPVGFVPNNVHSFGRYIYANNNPYKFTDPDGRSAVLISEYTQQVKSTIQEWAKSFNSIVESSGMSLAPEGELQAEVTVAKLTGAVAGLVPGYGALAVNITAGAVDMVQSGSGSALAGTASGQATTRALSTGNAKVKAASNIIAPLVGFVGSDKMKKYEEQKQKEHAENENKKENDD